MIAHHTATVPGVAAHPKCGKAISRLKSFKQRNGPFLMLADSISTALSQARFLTPKLRKLARQSWPGSVTFIFAAKPGLDPCCYQQGMIAIRVDADLGTRRLAYHCGGLMISSSLNRRGGKNHKPCYAVQMRWHRFLSGRSVVGEGRGEASALYLVERKGMHKLR